MSDSSRNHSDTNPAVSGSPARVSALSANPVPLHGTRRPAPRSWSRSPVPIADSILAPVSISTDLATVCVITCSVAAISPAATSRES
jgi:hypothetical protein